MGLTWVFFDFHDSAAVEGTSLWLPSKSKVRDSLAQAYFEYTTVETTLRLELGGLGNPDERFPFTPTE